MKKIFTGYLSIIMAFAVLALGICQYILVTRNINSEMEKSAFQQMEQIADLLQANQVELSNLEESLAEDYLTRAQAFAYIIEQNPDVLNSQEELKRIKELLNVDELHVIDGQGILIRGTEPRYFGLDFADGEQTAEFLQILEDPSHYLVQETQPNSADGRICQYVGVARADQPGIVQIGLYPERYVEAIKRNEWDYIFKRIPLEEYWFVEAIDEQDGTIRGITKPDMKEGHNGDAAARKAGLYEFEDGKLHSGICDDTWWTIKKYEDLGVYLCMAAPTRVLEEKRNQQMFLTILYIMLILSIVLLSVNYLVKRNIISGIQRITSAMRKITEGNLETVVQEGGNPEFEQLSSEINKMVESILHTTSRISKIIDLVDAPIGTFEYMEDMSRVLTTNRLQEVMGLSDEEAKDIFSSKRAFFLKLQGMMRYESEEKGIYRVGREPEKWLKIQIATENRRSFGIITDVTEEMQEKEKLRKERDYDTLTGLHNRRSFENEVKQKLEEKKDLPAAAMIMLDLDAFKQINDTYGHEFGDCYLRYAAQYLTNSYEDNCVVGRRSGDEFYVFDYGCSTREAVYIRLKEFYGQLRRHPVVMPDGEERPIAISAGIAFYEEGGGYEALLKAADDMLYRMKRSGKGYFKG